MKMPDLSTAADEVTVVNWCVQVGSPVKRGQVLLEVETDKSTMEVECIADGTLKAILVEANTTVSAGVPIAVIEGRGAGSPSSAKPESVEASGGSASTAPASTAAVVPPQKRSGGMFGRNRERATESSGATTMSAAQQVVARRMTESKQTVPHFYLQRTFNAESIIAAREASGSDKPVWDAFFVKALARALVKFPAMNMRADGTRLTPSDTDAIGVAADVNDNLYVIAVEGAQSKSIAEVSSAVRAGVSGIQSNSADAKRPRPAVMTLTNLGGCDIDAFIPIVNPPEAAILGIGRIAPTPVADGDKVVIQSRCALTLAVDHRVVNGKQAALFFAEIVNQLETFETD